MRHLNILLCFSIFSALACKTHSARDTETKQSISDTIISPDDGAHLQLDANFRKLMIDDEFFRALDLIRREVKVSESWYLRMGKIASVPTQTGNELHIWFTRNRQTGLSTEESQDLAIMVATFGQPADGPLQLLSVKNKFKDLAQAWPTNQTPLAVDETLKELLIEEEYASSIKTVKQAAGDAVMVVASVTKVKDAMRYTEVITMDFKREIWGEFNVDTKDHAKLFAKFAQPQDAGMILEHIKVEWAI